MFYRCKCYIQKNYYIPSLNKHVDYNDSSSFRSNLEKERQRRLNQDAESQARKQKILANYVPVHKCVYTLQREFLSPRFVEIVSYCKQPEADMNGLLKMIKSEKAERTYNFPVFTEAFCELFVQELENFEDSSLPKGRPNTMNNYGILLDEIGFYENFLNPLREDFLNPVCKILYPDYCGHHLDSHKAFIVTYKLGQDRDLSMHYDNAEVTLNISLGKDFEEGSLYFGSMRTEENGTSVKFTECEHSPTYGVLHRGQHMHGAMPIEQGERYNLIIWMRSSSVRNRLCPMCDRKPELVSASGFADGFTQETVDVCEVL